MASSGTTAPTATDIQNWIEGWRDQGYAGASGTTNPGAQPTSTGHISPNAQQGPIHPAFQVSDDNSGTVTSQEPWREVSRSWVYKCNWCKQTVKFRVAVSPHSAQQQEFKYLHLNGNCPKFGNNVPPISRDTPTRDLVESLSELHMRKKLTSSSQLGRDETEDAESSLPSQDFEREMSVFEITDENEIAQVRSEIKYNEMRKVCLPYNQAQVVMLEKVVAGATLLGSVYFFVTKGTHLPENAGPVLARIGEYVVRAGSKIPERLQPFVDRIMESIVDGAADLVGLDTTASIVARVIE